MQYREILALPWLLPGLVVWIVLAFALRGAVGRSLRAGPLLGWALIVCLGIVVSATLTPSHEAIGAGVSDTRYCDYSRVGLAPIEEFLKFGDAGLNILMFIPLGVAIRLLPRSGRKAAVVAAAIALPFAIEASQRLIPWLGRGCESADIVDNLTGLAIGLAIGVIAVWLLTGVQRKEG